MLQSAKRLQKPEYHGPTRTFYSTYPLLPPYKVIKECNYYTLKKESDVLTIDTSTAFWKLRLYWMRVKSWTITCLVFLVFSALKGPVGLRCLWGIEDFNYTMDIDSTTGEIYYISRSTVIGTFLTVLKGIKKSRAHFEEAPDLGLLGKNVSRIFNYIECYVFRLLFVGVILTILGYPVIILAASAVTIALVVTFWAWMPTMLFITYLFNILILQFETSVQRYDCLTRAFPLLTAFGQFFGSILVIILSGLNLVVLAPIRTLFIFGLLLIQQFFRRSLDKLMLTIFSKLGRTPSRDTKIAKKISGPGMTKEFYMSINE